MFLVLEGRGVMELDGVSTGTLTQGGGMTAGGKVARMYFVLRKRY